MRVDNFFPLKEANNQCQFKLTETQRSALDRVSSKIQSREYSTVVNRCLCHNKENDIVLANHDRFGLPFSFKLCRECSLIRTDPILDQSSLSSFYKNDFSLMHRGSATVTEEYFKRFLIQGEAFLGLLKRLDILKKVNNILEIGCSAGGNLYPLYKYGKNTLGYDYDINYLNYGRDLGMNLVEGDYYSAVPTGSQDLVILSHVMEHFQDPIGEVNKIIEKIKDNKYFLIEIPGVLHISKSVFTPLNYFQNDHIYHFNREYLLVFFRILGLDVVYSDDICRMVMKKPEGWTSCSPEAAIYDRLFKGHYLQIQNYIFKSYVEDKIFPYRRVKHSMGTFLRNNSLLKANEY